MKNTLFTFMLVAVLGSLAAAQDSRVLPPGTMRADTQGVSTQTGTEPVVRKNSYYSLFCPPKTCLYYAGDWDSTWSGDSSLFNANYNSGQLEGQVWVGVKPDRNATVTGATFVQILTSGIRGVNPTPFAVQVGIKPGQAGKTICNTSGNATYKVLGYYDEIPLYGVIIKKLSESCKLKKGRVYYVNLLPTSPNGFGGVVNLPSKPLNHQGWKNDLDDCYFNGTGFQDNYNYVTCNSLGIFSEFSIALTGKE